MRSRAKTGEAFSAASLHWFTYFVHTHGTQPDATTKARDYVALADIVRVQSHGDARRACALIEEIVDAPLRGGVLLHRYVQYWAWVEAGKPKRFAGSTYYLLESIYQCIQRNVRGAA